MNSRQPPCRNTLRVGLVSDCLAEPYHEGGRVLARGLVAGLSPRCQLLAVGTHPFSPPTGKVEWRPARREVVRVLNEFRPDVILTYPHASDTLPALVRARRLARQTTARIHVFLAYQQRFHSQVGWLCCRTFAPDLILCLSRQMRSRFRAHGLPAERIPCGVDLDRFAVSTPAEKYELRELHGVPATERLALHVGHAKRSRNLRWMVSACQRSGWQGVFVLSRFGAIDEGVLRLLTRAGIRVIDDDAPIEEWYRMADAYLFPVLNPRGCAEVPQSVLEALAAGLPVVSTPFGGLPDLLPAGDRILFADNEADFVSALRRLPVEPPRRPACIERLSWNIVGEEIIRLLEKVCA